MYLTIFKSIMSLLAIITVVCLAIYEAKTGQSINSIAYYILAWVVFGIQSDQVVKILDYFKKW